MAAAKTASKPLPSQHELNRLLRYEPETGKLYWRERTVDMFDSKRHSAAHTCAKWNSRCAGKEAFTANHLGYRKSSVYGLSVLAHRVIWKMQTGIEPENIDHIDGNRSNNKWSNLRGVTTAENRRNVARLKKNSSGQVGVRWAARCQKWQAYIGTLMLGTFSEFKDAVAARKAAEQKHNYHHNHGRKAYEELKT